MINLTALHNQRFFSYLSLFTFMMIILVTANNYLLMFLGPILGLYINYYIKYITICWNILLIVKDNQQETLSLLKQLSFCFFLLKWLKFYSENFLEGSSETIRGTFIL